VCIKNYERLLLNDSRYRHFNWELAAVAAAGKNLFVRQSPGCLFAVLALMLASSLNAFAPTKKRVAMNGMKLFT